MIIHRNILLSLFLIFSISSLAISAQKFNPVTGEIVDYTGINGGTLTNTKLCTYNSATGAIDCNTDPSAAAAAGGQNSVQYNNSGSLAGTETVFSMNGTNVGIGTTNAKLLFDVESSSATNKSMFVVAKSSSDGATNVGIGTFNPNTRGLTMYQRVNQQLAFNMNSGGGTTSSLRFTGSNAESGNSLVFQVSSSGQAPLAGLASGTSALYYSAADFLPFYIGTHSASDFGILTGDIPFTYFTVGQNVGIGTAAPGAKLSIVGNVGIGTIMDGDLFLTTLPPTGGIITEGNIGIGTYVSNSKLAVNGGASIGATYAGLKVKVGEMAITGNVGIGTFAPTKALQVGAATTPSVTLDAATTSTLTLNGSGGTSAIMTDLGITQINGVAAGLTEGTLTLNKGAGTTALIQNTGAGTMRIIGGADTGVNGAGVEIRTTSGAGDGTEYFKVTSGTAGATEVMRTLGSNLGIGSITPGTKLDVQGTIRGTTLQATGLASGQCVQTSTGGVFAVTGSACGSGGGSSQFSSQPPLGIGTVEPVAIGTYTPSSRLTVVGNIGISTLKNSEYVTIAPLTPIGLVVGGCVGIGTWKPYTALTVNGPVGIGTTTANLGAILNVIGDDDGSGVASNIMTAYGNTAANNSNFLYSINSQGNVGIGTSYAASRISIASGNINVASGNINASGSINSTAASMTAATFVSAGTQLRLVNSNSTISGTDGTQIVFGTGGSEVSRFNNSNLGIGSATPGTKLDVQGTTRMTAFQLTTSPNNGYVLTSDAGGTGTWQAGGAASSSWFTQAGTLGNVGVGTFSGVGIGTTMGNAALVVMPTPQGNNVGIGTWNPGTILDIQGPSPTLRIGSGATTLSQIANNSTTAVSEILITGGASTTSDLRFKSTSAAGTSDFIAYNTGNNIRAMTITGGTGQNVGIGTVTPVARLGIVGNIGIGTVGNGDLFLTTDPGLGNIIVEKNIGIGSTAPGVSLDVNGVTRISNSGDSYFGGNMGLGTTIPMGTLAVQGSIVQGTVAYTGRAVDTNTVALSGNVGIGTWNPTQQLIITGNVGISTTLSNSLIGSFSPSSPGGQLYVQGNVGIGSPTPGQNLDVFGQFRVIGGAGTVGSVKTGANTACTTTCGTSKCLLGEDTAVIGTIVACTDASADVCVCLGP